LTRERLSLPLWRRVISDIEAIVPVYERMNRVMSLGLDVDVRRAGILLLGECSVCLDVGAGPGDSLMVLLEEGKCAYIIGLEPSASLAGIAKERCSLCDVVVAVAEYMPFRSGSIDCITAFFSVRDFMDLDLSMSNFATIVRRQVVIGDIFLIRNKLLRLLQLAWVCIIVPVIAVVVAGRRWRNYLSLCKTLKGWLTPSELAGLMEDKGFTSLRMEEFAFGGLAIVSAWKGAGGYNRG
jgi:demethylmenaquinone methyltransferase/2-methoxy-6-polyprenyl-1,4-benzoquinol methylase